MNNFIWRRFGISLLCYGLLLSLSGCGNNSQEFDLQPIEDVAEVSNSSDGTDEERDSSDGINKQKDSSDSGSTILVHVCGAVGKPGVYELKSGARVCDALLLAGDFTEDADIDYLNQAEALCDGQKLYVPTEEESASDRDFAEEASNGGNGAAGGVSSDGRIDLNRADLSELKSLPGIGDVKAGAIISYREANGGFRSVEEIKQVSGIKDSLYESLKSRLYVGK